MVSLSLIHAASIDWQCPSRVIAPSPIDARLPGRCRKAAARIIWRLRKLWTKRCSALTKSPIKGRLAQLVERFLYTEDVGGSSPSSPTSLCSRSELGCRAEASGRRRACIRELRLGKPRAFVWSMSIFSKASTILTGSMSASPAICVLVWRSTTPVKSHTHQNMRLGH